jgi:uncharacterized protein (DUF1810 family)
MWFVFPQLRGLGRTETARFYGLESLEEARAYWQHELLGHRLADNMHLVLAVAGRTANQIFGSPDDLKFCSCLTLFEQVAPHEPVIVECLRKYFDGQRDALTLKLLAQQST